MDPLDKTTEPSPVKASPLYSLVIPAYQEEVIIDSSLTRVHQYLVSENLLGTTEVVVVAADGGDNTGLIAKRHSENFPHFQLIEPGDKVGKGRDVRIGMLAASGDYVVFTDADLATPIHYVAQAFERLETQSDVVIGTRDLKTIHTGFRSLLSRATNILTRAIVLPGISDTQCGFKGFTREAAHTVFPQTTINGWSFDIEALALARKYGCSISEITIEGWDDPKLDAGFVGENPIKAALKSLGELFTICYRLRTGKYKGQATTN